MSRLTAFAETSSLGYLPPTVQYINELLILDPTGLESFSLSDWLHDLRLAALLNQDNRCICGKSLYGSKIEIHHGLVTKKDAQSTPKDKRPFMLHHSYNVVAVHATCHPKLNRYECYRYLTDMYGVEPVLTWYDSLPWKCPPRRLGE